MESEEPRLPAVRCIAWLDVSRCHRVVVFDLFVQFSRARKRPYAERHGDEEAVHMQLAVAIHHAGYFCGATVLNEKIMATNDSVG